MLNPRQLYDLESETPDLRDAVLLYELRGFMDAGQAGQGVAEHLLSELEHTEVARFDMDQLIDYRGRRPVMTFDGDRWEHFERPQLVMYALRDENGSPFVLMTGQEPDLQWERFAAAVQSLVELWGIRLTVGVHGIPMGVPHTRPLGATGHATRQDLLPQSGTSLDRLQVPGSAAAVLEMRMGQSGHDALGFAVHVPHYLAQTVYPPASVRLLESIGEVTGLVLPQESLRQAGRDIDGEVDSQVRASEEVTNVVRALEEQYDMFSESTQQRSLLADSFAELPSGEELGEELERFLAERDSEA